MPSIRDTLSEFKSGQLDKAGYIRAMHQRHHATLFDYAEHLAQTNIQRIEIEHGRVVMTTRDRGLRMLCPPLDHRVAPIETLNFFDYERDDSDMIEALVGPGDVFFDIGANMGWYSILVALAQRSAQVHAFEPLPHSFAYLQHNLTLNPVRNVSAHPFGFSDRAGTFDFFHHPQGSGNASAVNLSGRPDVTITPCAVRTLDDFAAELGQRIAFIKCDVEGAELLVFRGGQQTIARDLPIVFSEILRKWSAKFGYDPNQIFDFFADLGYRAYTANGGRLQRFGRMDESTTATNFFFLHPQRHQPALARLS